MDLGHGLVYLRLFHPHPPTERKKNIKNTTKANKARKGAGADSGLARFERELGLGDLPRGVL